MIICPKCSAEVDERASYCPFCGAGIKDLQPAAAGEGPSGEADPFLGKVLAGNFRIEKKIGAGAMGKVYRARQLSLNKAVAVKILHSRLVGDEHLERRFHREAQAASRLSHPNSIQIIDYGNEDGALFIVMEHLEGRDLGQIIKAEHPLAWTRVCDLLAQVCAVLDEAHAAGIIHRDLKPENIMVVAHRSGGELVKVLDFGIAKLRDTGQPDGDKPLTFVGMVCGTPEYMAPEQARGIPITPRADLYAVGAILYKLLTDHVPFEAPSPLAVVTRTINDPPERPTRRRPDLQIPAALEDLCLRALAKEPEDRPASAREMREALLQIGAGLKAARPLAAPEPAPAPISAPGPVQEPAAAAMAAPAQPSPERAAALPAPAAPQRDRVPAPASCRGEPGPTVPLPPLQAGGSRDDAEAGPAPTVPIPLGSRPGRAARLVLVLIAALLLAGGAAGYLVWHHRAGVGGRDPDLGKVTVIKGRPAQGVAGVRPAAGTARSPAEGSAATAAAPRASDAAGTAEPAEPPAGAGSGSGGAAEVGAGPAATAPPPPSDKLASSGKPRPRDKHATTRPDPVKGKEPAQPAAASAASSAPAGEVGPASGASSFQRGRSLFLAGKIGEAITEYRKALQLGYSDPELYYELARCYARQRMPEQANQFYRRYAATGKDPKKLRAVEAILAAAGATAASPDETAAASGGAP